MNTINKISRHFNNLTQENLFNNNRVINFNNSNNVIWKGSKRYAH